MNIVCPVKKDERIASRFTPEHKEPPFPGMRKAVHQYELFSGFLYYQIYTDDGNKSGPNDQNRHRP